MKDRGQVAFEAYDQPGCKWAFQSAAERARWARVENAIHQARGTENDARFNQPQIIKGAPEQAVTDPGVNWDRGNLGH